MNTNFAQPHAGEIYKKTSFQRLNVRVLVLSVRSETDAGWLVYGLPVYSDDTYGIPALLFISRCDIALDKVRLPKCAAQALRQYRRMQRMSYRAYCNDDSCERDGYYFARGI